MPRPEKKPTEIITPVEIPGKNKGPAPSFTERYKWVKSLVWAFVLVLVVIGGVLLLSYLEQKPFKTDKIAESFVEPDPQMQEEPAAPSKIQPLETVYPINRAAEKRRAEQKLAEFTLVKNVLGEKGASAWGGKYYAEMLQLNQLADTFFIKKEYITASEKYTEAIAKATTLSGQMDQALVNLLEEGLMAMERGDGEGAQKKFIVALMIDPANDLAQHNLERVKKLENVMQLIESGKSFEEKGNLSFAHTDYQEALRLDSESKEAQKGLRRVKAQIQDEEFHQLMSEGLTAFHKNDYQHAKAKLLKAKPFRPKSHEVEDALTQVDQAIRWVRIDELRKDATKAELLENWGEALQSYLAILKIYPNVQLAAQGKERSLQQIRIEKRINFFLQNSSALESDSQLGNAVLLVHEAENIEPKGPRLTAQLKNLAQLVEAAQKPIKITIESDNLTAVAIYKVGQLGRFDVRELTLRPGIYTVVGSRDGYKDVRQKIMIKPGQEPLRINIKCTGKI